MASSIQYEVNLNSEKNKTCHSPLLRQIWDYKTFASIHVCHSDIKFAESLDCRCWCIKGTQKGLVIHGPINEKSNGLNDSESSWNGQGLFTPCTVKSYSISYQQMDSPLIFKCTGPHGEGHCSAVIAQAM